MLDLFDRSKHKLIAVDKDGQHIHVTVEMLEAEAKEVRVEQIREVRDRVPGELLDEIARMRARLDELERFATAASAEIIAARKEHASHEHQFQIAEHLEASTIIDGKPFPVTITQKRAAA